MLDEPIVKSVADARFATWAKLAALSGHNESLPIILGLVRTIQAYYAVLSWQHLARRTTCLALLSGCR